MKRTVKGQSLNSELKLGLRVKGARLKAIRLEGLDAGKLKSAEAWKRVSLEAIQQGGYQR